ncbi:MAG: hypothetical protein HY205_03700 [Nitrospirae bacterium]|nr:hypothetical protein [Nitrospirota bacterium]
MGKPAPSATRGNRYQRNKYPIPSRRTPQQQVLELAYYEGLAYQNIAARRNEPVGTIKTQIALGLSTLKTALRPCWGPP